MPTVFIEEIGQTVRFPDDMSNDEIGRVIQSEILPQYQQETTTTTPTPDPILSREEEIDKRQEDRSFLDSFTTGFKRSLRGTKDIFLEGGIRSLAEKTIGRDEEAKKYAEKYDQATRKMEEEIPATIPSWEKDVKNAEDFADYMLNNTGYFVGEIAQIGLGTVTGAGFLPAAAGVTAKALGKGALKASAKSTLAKTGGKAGFASVIYPKNLNETYHTFLEETDDPNLAMVYTVGTVNSALDAIVPAGILSKLGGEGRDKLSQHLVTRMLKGFVGGSVREGGTEGLQTLNNEFFDDYNLTEEEVGHVVEAIAFGATGGGPVGAVTSGISSPKAKEEAQPEQKQDVELFTALTDVKKGGGMGILDNPALKTKPPETTADVVKEEQALREETEEQMFNRLNGAESSFFDGWDLSKAAVASDGTVIGAVKKQKSSVLKEEKPTEQQQYRQTDNYKKGVEFVERRLQTLRDKGKQGEQTAKGIREILENRDISVGNALAAFRMGDIVNQILPQKADYTMSFADALTREIDGKEQNVQGVVNAGAKTMALALDMSKSFSNIRSAREAIQYQQETASHEAFHVLQDFFSQYDKSSSEILGRTFGSLNETVDYSTSPVKSWIRKSNLEMHKELMRMNAEAGGIKGSELQAYAFSVYDTARRNGKAPVMAGGLARYFRFLSQFLERLSNSLRGHGFRSAQDIFDMSSTGAFAATFDGQGLTTSGIAPEGDEDHSARPTRFLDKNMKKIYSPNADKDNLVKGPTGSTSLAKIAINKGERKQTVGLPMGVDYYDSETDLRNGYGARHIVGNHLKHIMENTPHTKVMPFIQEVVSNGKVKPVKGDQNRVSVNYKGAGYKTPATVILNRDQDRNIWTVTTAYPIIGGQVVSKTELSMLKQKEQLSARKGYQNYPFAPPPQKTVDNNGWADRIRRSEDRRKSYKEGVSNAPKNKSTEIVVDGKPVWYVGQKTYDQWLTGVEANLTQEQIADSLKWYAEAKPIFNNYFGKNWSLYLASWLMANQQASPSEAMKNTLKSLERVKNGIPVEGLNPAEYIENKKKYAKDGLPADTKAGLAAERLEKFWEYHFLGKNKGKKAPVGGQKLYDFVDAGMGKKTRTWMGDQPEGGQPAVADVHSLRGVGMYDDVVKKRLEKLIGKPAVKKLNLQIDATGSPSEPTYEKSADFLREVADYLNSTGRFNALNNGKPITAEQAQAVDWMAVISFLGNAGETPTQAIQKNVWALNFELAFGTNTPYSQKYSVFSKLPTYEQKNISQLMLEDVSTFARNITGAREHLRTHATGGWLDNGSNPNTKSDLIASEEAVLNTAAIIGYIAEQDAMFSYRYSGLTNKSHYGVIIKPKKGSMLNNAPTMDSLWQAMQAEPALKNEFLGFATETIDGNSAMFISLDAKAKSKKGENFEKRLAKGDIKEALDKVSMETGFDLEGETVYHERNFLENDYSSEEGKNGGIYLQRIRRQLGEETAQRVENYKRSEYEPRLEALIREGFKNEGTKQAQNPSNDNAKRLRYSNQFSARSGQPNPQIQEVAKNYLNDYLLSVKLENAVEEEFKYSTAYQNAYKGITDPETQLNAEGQKLYAQIAKRVSETKQKFLNRPEYRFSDEEVVEDIKLLQPYFEKVGVHQEHAIHRPFDDYVLETYDPFMLEVLSQYSFLKETGLQILPWKEEGQPYQNSVEMMEDISKNNRLYFFMTDTGFGEFGTGDLQHPLLEASDATNSLGEPMLYNDMFRVVHDYFGHGQKGFSFSALGEYNAFREHLTMFSPEARSALAAETLFQNAWLVYGPHIKQDGKFPEVGDPNYIPIKDRDFSEQKAHRPPLELLRELPNKDGEQSRQFPTPKSDYERRLELLQRDFYNKQVVNNPEINQYTKVILDQESPNLISEIYLHSHSDMSYAVETLREAVAKARSEEFQDHIKMGFFAEPNFITGKVPEKFSKDDFDSMYVTLEQLDQDKQEYNRLQDLAAEAEAIGQDPETNPDEVLWKYDYEDILENDPSIRRINDTTIGDIQIDLALLTQKWIKDMPDRLSVYRTGLLKAQDGKELIADFGEGGVASFSFNPYFMHWLMWKDDQGNMAKPVRYTVDKKDILLALDIAPKVSERLGEDEIIIPISKVKPEHQNLKVVGQDTRAGQMGFLKGDEYSQRQGSEPFANVLIKKDDNSIYNWLGAFGRIDWKNLGRTIEYDLFDSVSPIADLERAKNYAETGRWELNDGQNSPYKKIMMAKNTAGRAETVLMNGAPIMDKDGFLSIDEDSPSLVNIYNRLTSAKEAMDYSKYAIARRAKDLRAQDKENLVTPEEIEIGLALENQKFKAMFEDYQVYNRKLLDFLESSGVISKLERENLGKYDYVPFYREMREDRYDKKTGIEMKDTLGPRISRVLNNPNPYIEKYTGGTLPIGDIIDNTVRNTQAFLRAAVNNHAMQESVKLFKEAGIGKEIKQNQRGKDTFYVTYREEGKKKYYDVENPLIYTSLASMSPQQTRGLFGLMESVGKVFRDFITHQPAFMVANLIRGEVSGLVSVDAPVTPVVDSVKGFVATLKNDEVVREMKLNAGVGGFSFGDDISDVGKKLRRDRRLNNRDYRIIDTPLAVSDVVSKLWSGLTKTGEASELAFRHAVYKKLLETENPRTGELYSKQEANYQALNVINFNRKGALSSSVGQMLGTIIPLVPFLNARLQGLYRTLDPLVTGRQASRQRFIRNGALLGLASFLLYDLASDDERYDAEPLYRKLNYHIFYVGENRYLIPRAFEVGAIFTTLPEMTIDAFRKENGDQLWKALKMTFLNTFSFNPIPQAVKPLIEIGVNYDFFKGQPIDNYAEMNYLPAQRTGPNTPQVSQSISQIGQDVLGGTLSPNQISKLVVGYLGSMGTMALTSFDVAMANSGLAPSRATGAYGDGVFGKFMDISGFGRFKKDQLDASNQYITNFYEIKEDVDQIHNTVNRLIKDGKVEQAQELMRDNVKLLAYRPALNKYYQAFREVNAVIRNIKLNDGLSPAEKRSRLLVLNNRKNQLAGSFNKIYRQMKEVQ